MQRGREVRGNSNNSRSIFHDFGGGFGSRGSMFPSIFGGSDPFDDPFFTHPFGSVFNSGLFGSSMFGSSSAPRGPQHPTTQPKGPVIQEIDSEDEDLMEEDNEGTEPNADKDKYQENAFANRNPLVEHPDDEQVNGLADHAKSVNEGRELAYRTDQNKVEPPRPKTQSVSFKKVTYGGIDGVYYTASSTRSTGSDGVTLEESKQADRTTGQATHRISRRIHDKGHSVTRKLDSDGKVDTMQTLHNLEEDELAGFEQAWRGNADRHVAGHDARFSFPQNSGADGSMQGGLTIWGGSADPFRELYGRDRVTNFDRDPQYTGPSGGRPKKVVRINID